MSSAPDPLKDFLETVYHVEVDDVAGWRMQVEAKMITNEEVDLLRNQLAHAIRHRTISPEEYMRLTKEDLYDMPEGVEQALRELWCEMFGDEPLPE